MRKELCSARVTAVVWIILSRAKWQMLRNGVDEGWRSSRRSQKLNWLRVSIQPFSCNLTSYKPLGRWIRKTRLDSASFKWKLSELQKSAKQKRKCVSNLTFPLVAASFALLTPPNQCARSDEHFPHRRTRTKGLLTEEEEAIIAKARNNQRLSQRLLLMKIRK